jgi:hypothetical protein
LGEETEWALLGATLLIGAPRFAPAAWRPGRPALPLLLFGAGAAVLLGLRLGAFGQVADGGMLERALVLAGATFVAGAHVASWRRGGRCAARGAPSARSAVRQTHRVSPLVRTASAEVATAAGDALRVGAVLVALVATDLAAQTPDAPRDAAAAPAARAVVRGVVRDSAGRPVPGARLALVDLGGREAAATADGPGVFTVAAPTRRAWW